MARLCRTANTATVLACIAVAGFAQVSFKPAQVASVADAYLPYEVVYDGFVVLEVFLDKDGTLVETKTLRDPGAMTPAALASVNAWKFHPASGGDRTLPSAATVVFVYRPRDNGPAPVLAPKNFKPVLPDAQVHTDGGRDYIPPGVVSVAYPDYPVNSVAWGSVVVQVTVNAEGKAENPGVLYGTAPFKDLALKALEKWRFQPATLEGKPVLSQIPIAFVFQTPNSSW